MLLECLVGVSYSDIVNDYFLSFYNFFKVLPGSISYAPITLRVDKMMKRTFKVEEIDKTKLSLYAYSYFINIGLDKTEVEQLISLLKR